MRIKAQGEKIEWNNIDYNDCLAKTDREDSNILPGMSITEHSLLSGKVAGCLSSIFPYQNSIKLYPEGFQYLVSLHDIGKISPYFQAMIAEHLHKDDTKKRNKAIDVHTNHAEVGYIALSGSDPTAARIAAMHHGGLKGNSLTNNPNAEIFGGDSWQKARMEFIRAMAREFPNCDIQFPNAHYLTFLCGLTVVSDWIASSIPKSKLRESSIEELASQAVAETGLKSLCIKKGLTFYDIFGFEERQEQGSFFRIISKPGVYMLETEMGTGKTEAALYAAYMLLEKGQAEGIYFALPTAISSRQIYSRFNDFLQKITSDESGEARLIYGNSHLYYKSSPSMIGDTWFDSKKKMMLSPFGVGTIDQALLGVLNVKHSCLRAFGLAGKVVILDEVHSYDSYTGALIDKLIEMLISLGSTVIILSATLRNEAKKELIGNRTITLRKEYPIATAFIEGNIKEIPIKIAKEKKVHIDVISDETSAIDNAIEKAFDGNLVLWIENTVDKAQQIYSIMNSRCDGEIEVGLLHSRFVDPDRAKKENRYTSIFGKQGSRENGYILIGTQVLEQSLDIDADLLVTRIAPMDMLIQRMGRLWRHERQQRKLVYPSCSIIVPSESIIQNSDISEAYGDSGRIYSPYVLCRTQIVISSRSDICFPTDVRRLLDDVYEDVDEQDERMQKAKQLLIEKRERQQRKARSAMMEIWNPMIDDDACTRYDESGSRRILILKSIDENKGMIETIDDEILNLSDRSLRHTSMVSLRLEESMINVTARNFRGLLIDPGKISLLRRYIYIAENEGDRIGVLLWDRESLYDLNGKEVEDFKYSRKLGYIKK